MTKIATRIPTPPKPGSQTFGFRLGDRVRDRLSQVEGIAIVRLYHISGCDTFVIEMDPTEGKNDRGKLTDLNGDRIELVEAKPDFHKNEVPDIDIHLGDEVLDLVHGIAGIATHIVVPLFGAVQVQISPKWDAKEKKVPEAWIVDAHHVEVVKPLDPPVKAAAKPKAPAERGCTPVASNINW